MKSTKNCGGILAYGIPEFRLPRDILEKTINKITSIPGIKVETNKELRKDFNLQELSNNYDAVFLAIGSNPDTNIYKNKLDLNDYGYIKTDANLQTSIKGVFAGGDVIEKQIRQIITACSDGAVCATNANSFIKENF